MDRKRRLGGPEIRLLLAVLLVGIFFFGMEPSIFEENICNAITTEELYPRGHILITNLSPHMVTINFSGTQSFSEIIRPEYQMEVVAKEGSYAWVAYFMDSDYRAISGFVKVEEGKRRGVTLKTGKKK